MFKNGSSGKTDFTEALVQTPGYRVAHRFLSGAPDEDIDVEKLLHPAQYVLSRPVRTLFRREFGAKIMPWLGLFVELRRISMIHDLGLGEAAPIEPDVFGRLFAETRKLLRVKGRSDKKPLSSLVRGKCVLSVRGLRKHIVKIEKGTAQKRDWESAASTLAELIETIGRDKGIYLGQKRGTKATYWFPIFRKMSGKEKKLVDLQDRDPETYAAVVNDRRSLEEIDNEIKLNIEDNGQVGQMTMVRGRAVMLGVDPKTGEMLAYDRGMEPLAIQKIPNPNYDPNKKRSPKEIWDGPYVEKLKKRDKAKRKLTTAPDRATLLSPHALTKVRTVTNDDMEAMAEGAVEYVSLTDDKAKESAITRVYPTQWIKRVYQDQNDPETGEAPRIVMERVIVDGRFKGCMLNDVVNANGRMIEGTTYTYDPKNGKPVPKEESGKDSRSYNEPFITVVEQKDRHGKMVKRLQISLPNRRATPKLKERDPEEYRQVKALQRIKSSINRLASNTPVKTGSINSLIQEDSGIFTFDLKDFSTVQEIIGGTGMALSEGAVGTVNKHYEDQSKAEQATADRNLGFYSKRSLGGFKKGSPPLLKVQKKAMAWLDANDNRGVIALDTGVGKTVTSISSMQKMLRDGMGEDDYTYEDSTGKIIKPNGRFLWVCPPGLEGNLPGEIKKWLSPTPVGEDDFDDDSEEGMARTAFLHRLADSGVAPADMLASKVDCMSYRTYGAAAKKGHWSVKGSKVTKTSSEYWNAHYEAGGKWDHKDYVALYYDEAQNMTSMGTNASAAALQLDHPHKICLTASAMEKNPQDSYVLQAICQNIPLSTRKDANKAQKAEARDYRRKMRRFNERYCEKVGPRIVGIKDDPTLQRELETWTKQNIFYADKKEVEYAKDPETGEPGKLVSMNSNSVSVQMQPEVEEIYRTVTSGFAKIMKAMEVTFRDHGCAPSEGEGEGDEGDCFVAMRDKETGEPLLELDDDGEPIIDTITGKPRVRYKTDAAGNPLRKLDPILTKDMRDKVDRVFGRKMAGLVKLMNGLSNYPQETLLELADMMDGKKEAPAVLANGPRGTPAGLGILNLLRKAHKPDELRALALEAGNPKIDEAAEIVTRKRENDVSARTLLFTDDLKMIEMTAIKLSKEMPGYHIAATSTEMRVFEAGKEIDQIEVPIPLAVRKLAFAPKGRVPGEPELTDDEKASRVVDAKKRRKDWEAENGTKAIHKLPFRERRIRPFPTLPSPSGKAWVKEHNPWTPAKEWPVFVFQQIASPSPKFKTITLYGKRYSTGQNLQAFNTVVHLDRDSWNSEEMKQRTARAWRQGQKHVVDEFTLDATYAATESPSEGGLDKTLDEIRGFFQKMQSDMFDDMIKRSMHADLGGEWEEVTQSDASIRNTSRNTMEFVLSPSPYNKPSRSTGGDEPPARVASRHMAKTAASMARHIRALQKMFPKSARIDTTEAFGSGQGGIWTSFGEEGIANYYRAGYPNEFDPKLQKYMDKHGLYGEWHDAGTLMIYPV